MLEPRKQPAQEPAGQASARAWGAASPFRAGYRGSGVLLHLTSLPSAYGIGDWGPQTLAWIDRLAEAEQSWWQFLPLTPPAHGDSPFEPSSTFALNPFLISPAELVAEGLLQPGDCLGAPASDTEIDFQGVAAFKNRLIELAWRNFRSNVRPDLQDELDRFCNREADWLEDYALFCALKRKHRGAPFYEWPAGELAREAAVLQEVSQELSESLEIVRFGQFLANRQAGAVKAHALRRGIGLIGDLPFFVALDSADVWSRPELFLLDADRKPRFLSGVPPDYFSAVGQLWGTPVYDWQSHLETGYEWWTRRIRSLLKHVDLIRLDHFRAFAAAWHVPAGASTAEHGTWVPGPGDRLFESLRQALGGLPLIAEDLGLLTPEVYELRDRFRLPGMRVLQFAFDGDEHNPFLPHNYAANTVVYTGTHDNDTLRGWWHALSNEERSRVWKYLQRPAADGTEPTWELIRLAWQSPAALAMVPLQDVLELDSSARMNVPGSTVGNWRWRCSEEMLQSPALGRLAELTRDTARSVSAEPSGAVA